MSRAARTGVRLALRSWVREPEQALAILRASQRSLDGHELGVKAWLELRFGRDLGAAERSAREAIAAGGDNRYALATLAELQQRRGCPAEAVAAIEQARERFKSRWYELTLADVLIEGQPALAERVLEAALSDPQLYRHCVKRLSKLALERGDRERALGWYRALVDLDGDYLVYASDFTTLAELQLETGDTEGARQTLASAARAYPRNEQVAAMREKKFDATEALATPRVAPVSESEVGAKRIPVRLPLVDAASDLPAMIAAAIKQIRRPGDTVTLAESVAATAQGRLLPLELVRPGLQARFLSRFVGQEGPLHSPEGMQGAIMEVGALRVWAASAAGAIGKLVRRSGWFYLLAGPQTAMIDDVAAFMPPNDHHLVFGPLYPNSLAADIASELGLDVAIVDANHKTGAWVVGASEGVDRNFIERALADNPAGNEDEQTPVVIVRRLSDSGDGEPSGKQKLSVSFG